MTRLTTLRMCSVFPILTVSFNILCPYFLLQGPLEYETLLAYEQDAAKECVRMYHLSSFLFNKLLEYGLNHVFLNLCPLQLYN